MTKVTFLDFAVTIIYTTVSWILNIVGSKLIFDKKKWREFLTDVKQFQLEFPIIFIFT